MREDGMSEKYGQGRGPLLNLLEPKRARKYQHVKDAAEDDENAAGKKKALLLHGGEAWGYVDCFVSDLSGAQTNAGRDAAEKDEKGRQG
jgi:hypothetical protein